VSLGDDIIERRPRGASTTDRRFPRRWIERNGEPPEGKVELRDWIKRNIVAEGGTSIRDALDEGGGIERRSAHTAPAPGSSTRHATRAKGSVPAGGANVVTGIGVPFMEQTLIAGAFWEQFHPDAFAAQQRAGWTSKYGSAMGLWQHDRDQPLASVRGQSLAFNVTRSELLYAMALPDSAIGEHVAALVQRQDVDGASIGFVPEVDVWTYDEDDETAPPLVTVMQAELVEQSIVWAPAYRGTTAELERVKPLTPAEQRQRFEAREWMFEQRMRQHERDMRWADLEADCRQVLRSRGRSWSRSR
jgi:HK97 family phage prohead protease